eukprot:Nk52_evm12s564 gene=Nk52_evmTU12s564
MGKEGGKGDCVPVEGGAAEVDDTDVIEIHESDICGSSTRALNRERSFLQLSLEFNDLLMQKSRATRNVLTDIHKLRDQVKETPEHLLESMGVTREELAADVVTTVVYTREELEMIDGSDSEMKISRQTSQEKNEWLNHDKEHLYCRLFVDGYKSIPFSDIFFKGLERMTRLKQKLTSLKRRLLSRLRGNTSASGDDDGDKEEVTFLEMIFIIYAVPVEFLVICLVGVFQYMGLTLPAVCLLVHFLSFCVGLALELSSIISYKFWVVAHIGGFGVAVFLLVAFMGGILNSGVFLSTIIPLPSLVYLFTRNVQICKRLSIIIVLGLLVFYGMEMTSQLDAFDISKDLISDIDPEQFSLVLTYFLATSVLVFMYLIYIIMTVQTEHTMKESSELLQNILPFPIQETIQANACHPPSSRGLVVRSFDSATVFFCDMTSFTTVSSKMPPSLLVEALNYVFSTMDILTVKFGVEKIKTVGDAYMAVAGLFEDSYNKESKLNTSRSMNYVRRDVQLNLSAADFCSAVDDEFDLPPLIEGNHAQRMCQFALAVRDAVRHMYTKQNFPFQMRFGVHSGPVVAGVIGVKKFQFDVWGDTVNTASRMESTGLSGNVHVSKAHAVLLEGMFLLLEREEIEVKGKGRMKTYIVVSRKSEENDSISATLDRTLQDLDLKDTVTNLDFILSITADCNRGEEMEGKSTSREIEEELMYKEQGKGSSTDVNTEEDKEDRWLCRVSDESVDLQTQLVPTANQSKLRSKVQELSSRLTFAFNAIAYRCFGAREISNRKQLHLTARTERDGYKNVREKRQSSLQVAYIINTTLNIFVSTFHIICFTSIGFVYAAQVVAGYVVAKFLLIVMHLAGIVPYLPFVSTLTMSLSLICVALTFLMGGTVGSGALAVLVLVQTPITDIVYTKKILIGTCHLAMNVILFWTIYTLEYHGLMDEWDPDSQLSSTINERKAILSLVYVLLIAVALGTTSMALYCMADMDNISHETQELLDNVLPFPVQEELRLAQKTRKLVVQSHQSASVFFCDMVSFTTVASSLEPRKLVQSLNDIFSTMDFITTKFGVEKIKTIGDSYMAVTGLFEKNYEQEIAQHKRVKKWSSNKVAPVENEGANENSSYNRKYSIRESSRFAWLPYFEGNHAQRMCQFALTVRDTVHDMYTKQNFPFQMRFGVHSGPVVAGVIGVKKFQFDVWGDTVNTASRMESTGLSGNVHVSKAHAVLLNGMFLLLEREEIEVKGKGRMKTYIVLSRVDTGGLASIAE